MLNYRLIIVLICLFNVSRFGCSGFNISNGTIDTKYTSFISDASLHVYVFEFSIVNTSYRIETSVDSSDVGLPAQISVNHQMCFESWFLPIKFYLHPQDIITSANRISCPTGLSNSTTNKLTIKIQTFSMNPIQYSLRVVQIESNVIQLGQNSSVLSNPASKTFFVTYFPVGVEIMEIRLSSRSKLCSLVRVTSLSCPPDFSLRSSKEIKGYDLTMTEEAGLRVKRSDFTRDRIMILLIPLPASRCETNVEYSMNSSSENYAKNTSLLITAGNEKFWEPILIITALFLVPYVMFVVIMGLEILWAHRLPQLTKHISLFSRVRRVWVKSVDGSYEPVTESDKRKGVELEAAQIAPQAPSTNENQTIESMENAVDPGENVLERYKCQLAKDDVSYCGRGRYYFDIINNKDIKLKDLNLKSEWHLRETEILYLCFVVIIGIFYIVPAVQVSYYEMLRMSLTGEQDLCYINFKCDREYSSLRAFNNIWSNVGYILLSILILIITIVKNISFVRECRAQGCSTTGTP